MARTSRRERSWRLPGQAKLLRVLQNRVVQRVGSPVVRHVDIRVVVATHRDLRAMVADKLFERIFITVFQ
jgi:transcriptional regulator with GAF, ATPase, and Fis domain